MEEEEAMWAGRQRLGDAATGQGLPAGTGSPERQGANAPRVSRESEAPWTPWLWPRDPSFRFCASRTVRGYISVVWSHPVCETLLVKSKTLIHLGLWDLIHPWVCRHPIGLSSLAWLVLPLSPDLLPLLCFWPVSWPLLVSIYTRFLSDFTQSHDFVCLSKTTECTFPAQIALSSRGCLFDISTCIPR